MRRILADDPVVCNRLGRLPRNIHRAYGGASQTAGPGMRRRRPRRAWAHPIRPVPQPKRDPGGIDDAEPRPYVGGLDAGDPGPAPHPGSPGDGAIQMPDLNQERTSAAPALAERQPDASVLTCAACGCRLTVRDRTYGVGPDAAWRHFPGAWGHDARGCLVACVDEPHRMASAHRAAA